MRHTEMTKQKLAAKSGVSERMIGYVLAKEKAPTIEVADALAGAFDLPGWMLLLPDLPVRIAKTGRLQTLIGKYVLSSDAGREYIDRVAEHEAKYRDK